VTSEGVPDVARELRGAKDGLPMPILVYARGAAVATDLDALAHATDADLVSYVDKQQR
jgi:hypothetical protein